MTLEKPDALRIALRKSYDKYLVGLGADAINDMAYRSYLFGNPLSQYVFWKKLEFVVTAAQLRPNQSVLDFGCGSGILLPTLCNEDRTVVATDLRLTPAQFLAEKMSLKQVSFAPSDAWHQIIGDQSLDAIIAANVLEHVDEREFVLRQFARKLKRNGRLVISGPTENTLYKLGRRIVGFSGEYHVATVRDVLDDAHAAGFNEVFRRNWPLPKSLCLYQIVAFVVR